MELPQRFKPGQEVVCVNKDVWYDVGLSLFTGGPKYNEVVSVIRYTEYHSEHGWGIAIDGYENDYKELCFEPLIPAEAITALLEESIHAEV